MALVVTLWSSIGVAAPMRAAPSSAPAQEAWSIAPSSIVPASVTSPILSAEVAADGEADTGLGAGATPTGAQAGTYWKDGSVISRWTFEPSAFMTMIGRSVSWSTGMWRNAMSWPSGDQAGPISSPVAQG